MKIEVHEDVSEVEGGAELEVVRIVAECEARGEPGRGNLRVLGVGTGGAQLEKLERLVGEREFSEGESCAELTIDLASTETGLFEGPLEGLVAESEADEEGLNRDGEEELLREVAEALDDEGFFASGWGGSSWTEEVRELGEFVEVGGKGDRLREGGFEARQGPGVGEF